MKTDLKIDWCSNEAAKYACLNWHYTRAVPIGKLVKVGVWEDGKFIGCVIFSRGTCAHLGKRFGFNQTQACELTRVALNSHKTEVSKIIKIALIFFKKKNPDMKLVVSFAAQIQGHNGGIYQAGNWIYEGETLFVQEYIYKGKRATDRQIAQLSVDTKTGKKELERLGVIKRTETKTKYRYLMPLDKATRKKLLPLAKPYPKRTLEEGQ